MLRKGAGFLGTIFGAIGLVVFVDIFILIMAQFDAGWLIAGVEDLFLMGIILGWGPTLLLLGGIGGFGTMLLMGYSSVAKNLSGLIRLIMSGVDLILFFTLYFTNILPAFIDLYAAYVGDPNYPIFDLVCSIVPGVMLLSVIGGVAYQGVSTFRHRKKGGMATI